MLMNESGELQDLLTKIEVIVFLQLIIGNMHWIFTIENVFLNWLLFFCYKLMIPNWNWLANQKLLNKCVRAINTCRIIVSERIAGTSPQHFSLVWNNCPRILSMGRPYDISTKPSVGPNICAVSTIKRQKMPDYSRLR